MIFQLCSNISFMIFIFLMKPEKFSDNIYKTAKHLKVIQLQY